MRRWQLAIAAAGALWASAAAAAVDPGSATAPRMEFKAPQPGSYTLQRIQPVADAALLDPSGQPARLASVTAGKITLLTFFYTYCADPLGCPFAYHTLTSVRNAVSESADLARRVRVVSISLDPTVDTPEAIGRYRDMVMHDSTVEWDVLTARSVRQLLPVLTDFGQDVSVERGGDGAARRTVHHMLKMFLIDREGIVREVYSLAYLQPDVIVNDVRTLYLEEQAASARSRRQVAFRPPAAGRVAGRGSGD